MSDRARLAQLTDRWRRRRAARRPASRRPMAPPEREALASRAFPYRSTSPAAYVAEHGDVVCREAGVAPPRLGWRRRDAEASTGIARRDAGLIAVRAGSDPLDQ